MMSKRKLDDREDLHAAPAAGADLFGFISLHRRVRLNRAVMMINMRYGDNGWRTKIFWGDYVKINVGMAQNRTSFLTTSLDFIK